MIRAILAGVMVVSAVVSGGQTGVKTVHRAVGTFEVKMKPEPLSEVAAKSGIMRMSIDKVIHAGTPGGLEATTKGEFLASGSPDGSGGYVAMETVTGTLDGKTGSFVLQHTATMNAKVPTMSITVVPGSGTGELVGLTGTFTVMIEGGKHSYVFDYSL
jgi:hypothetical protein